MTKRKSTRLEASVSARLSKLARERRDDFQLVLLRYANERLLYRLARSPHADSFVLKGAALFTVWTGRPHRATRDIDLLGFGDTTEAHIRDVFAEVLAHEVADDGLRFDLSTILEAERGRARLTARHRTQRGARLHANRAAPVELNCENALSYTGP